jgi:hypothetical protein
MKTVKVEITKELETLMADFARFIETNPRLVETNSKEKLVEIFLEQA